MSQRQIFYFSRNVSLGVSVLFLAFLSACEPLQQILKDIENDLTPPTALTLTGPAQVTAGICGGPFYVDTVDNHGKAKAVLFDTQVHLFGQGNGSFYSDATCSKPIQSTQLASGVQSAAVYYMDPMTEYLELGARADELSTATLSISVMAAGQLSIVGGSPVQFGTANLGSTITSVLTLENTGSQPVTLGSMSQVTAPFQIISGGYPGHCANPLPVGSSCSLTIAFFSSVPVQASQDLSFTYSMGEDEETLRVTLEASAASLTPPPPPPPGTIDTTFGSNGSVFSSWSGGKAVANAVALQSDGKIIVAGKVQEQFAVARYNGNGMLDTSFGAGGLVQIPSLHEAHALAVQSDGKILAVGEGNLGFGIVRLLPTGWIDTSFKGNGIFTTRTGAFGGVAQAVILLGDGSFYVGGHNYIDFAIAKYKPNGQLDDCFGHGGIQYTDIFSGSLDEASAMAVQPDGKIILVGTSYNFGLSTYVAAVRYTTAGMPDPTFNSTGINAMATGQPLTFVSSVVVQPSGGILIGGDANAKSLVIRLTSSGTQDSNFYGGGIELIDFGTLSFGRSLTLLPCGAFVLVGFNQIPGKQDYELALAQFTADGVPDITLNGNGRLSYPLGSDSAFMRASVLQPDGKLVIVGNTWSSLALTRLTP